VGFDWFVDGEQRRRFWSVEGEATSAGTPVQGEPPGGLEEMDSFERDEWSIVEVVEALSVSWDVLNQADYQTFRIGTG
jgi:hypothetical protein